MKPAPEVAGSTIRRVTVAEAARLLGVSERTVYRRLKSGHLRSVTGVSELSDRASLIIEIEIEEQFEMSDTVRQLSDGVSSRELDDLRADLRRKDEQIQCLLDNEKALAQTIQKMQEQLHELARYVLSQHASAKGQTPGVRDNAGDNPGKGAARLSRLFPGFRKRDNGEGGK